MKTIPAILALLFSASLYSQTQDWRTVARNQDATLEQIQAAYRAQFEDSDPPEDEAKVFRWFEYWWKDRSGSNLNGNGELKEYTATLEEWLTNYPYCAEEDKANWKLEGPKFDGSSSTIRDIGRVMAVWSNPLNPNVILCGADDGSGIWRTEDHGENWTNVTDELRLPGLGISSFAANSDNSLIYASTGNTNLLRRPYGPGILVSCDQGLSWQVVGVFELSDNTIFSSLKFSEKHNGILYAVRTRDQDEDLIIYNTKNTYNTFFGIEPNAYSVIDFPDLGFANQIQDLALIYDEINPESDEIIYASSGSSSTPNPAVLLRTTDANLVWQDITSQLNYMNEYNYINGTFDVNDQLWSNSGWDHVLGLLPTGAMGIMDTDDYEIGSFGNQLRPLNFEPLLYTDADYTVNFHAHIPAGVELELYVLIGVPQTNPNINQARWNYKLWSSGMQTTEFEDDFSLPFSTTDRNIWLEDHVIGAIDPFDGHEVEAENIPELQETNKTIKLRWRAKKNGTYIYIDDLDLTDLMWIDDIDIDYANENAILRDLIAIEAKDNDLYIWVNSANTGNLVMTIEKLNLNDEIETLFVDRDLFVDYHRGSAYKSMFGVSPYTGAIFFGSVEYMAIRDGNLIFQSNDLIHDDVRCIAFEPVMNGADDKVIIGTDGCLNYTTDYGTTWTYWANLPITQFYGMAKRKQFINAGALDNHNYVGENSNFTRIGGGDGGRCVFPDPLNDVSFSWENELIVKFDHVTYPPTLSTLLTPPFVGDQPGSEAAFILDLPLEANPNFPDRVYYSRDQIYYSPTNVPDQYTMITVPNIDDEYLNVNGGSTKYRGALNAIAFSHSDPNVFFVAESGSVNVQIANIQDVKYKFYKHTSSNPEWIDLTAEMPNNTNGVLREAYLYYGIRDILVDPSNQDHLWICFPGIGIDENGAAKFRVLESTNGGITWSDVSAGLPPLPILTLEYDNTAHILYAGTDVGVFYKRGLQEWTCFSDGLPPCVVTDLDIDYCEGRIYASTFGRGIWSSDLVQTNNATEFTSNYIFEQDAVILGNILVTNESTLSIPENVTLFVSGNARIIVDEGCKLYVKGKIKCADCANGYFWNGIEMVGNIEEEQDPEIQSTVDLEGAEIWNAKIGVSTISTYYSNEYDFLVSNSGGIITAENTSFYDCGFGIQIVNYPYEGLYETYEEIPDNASFIDNCNFIWQDGFYEDKEVKLPDLTVRYPQPIGIKAAHVKGLKITRCNFTDENVEYFPRLRAIGVHSNSATTKVVAYDDNGTFIPNVFDDLCYGVFATSSDPISTVRVDRGEFNNCFMGVGLAAMQFPSVTRCNFDIDAQPEGVMTEAIGIWINASSGYEIEDNQFNGNCLPEDTEREFGIYVKNSYAPSEEVHAPLMIYHNSFDNVVVGIAIEGKNDDIDNEDGLQLKCNTFTGSLENNYDIALVEKNSTVAPSQGSTGSTTDPAGNNFGPIPNFSDFFIVEDGMQLDAYWHHIPNPSFRFVPTENSNLANPQPSLEAYQNGVSCESDVSEFQFTGSHLQGKLDNSKQILLNSRDIYNNVIDNGNSVWLENFIENLNNTSSEVRDAMLSSYPVSDENLKLAMKRTIPLNHWHMAQVLIANSPLTPSVKGYMYDFGNLPDFYDELVEGEQGNGISNSGILKADLASDAQVFRDNANDYIRGWLWGQDSCDLQIISHLRDSFPCKEYTLLEVGRLEKIGQYESSYELLDDYYKEFEIGDAYFEIWNILTQQQLAGKDETQLDPNQIASLRSFAEAGEAGAAQSEAILELAEGRVPVIEPVFPAEERSTYFESIKPKVVDPGLLQVMPNPSKGQVQIVAKSLEDVEKAIIQVFNSSGQMLEQFGVGNQSAQILDKDYSKLPSGSYYFALLWDGIKVDQETFIIEK